MSYIKAITLPETGVDWMLIQTPIVDIATNPHHIPMAYAPGLHRWCKIGASNGKLLQDFLELENLEHFYNA